MGMIAASCVQFSNNTRSLLEQGSQLPLPIGMVAREQDHVVRSRQGVDAVNLHETHGSMSASNPDDVNVCWGVEDRPCTASSTRRTSVLEMWANVGIIAPLKLPCRLATISRNRAIHQER